MTMGLLVLAGALVVPPGYRRLRTRMRAREIEDGD